MVGTPAFALRAPAGLAHPYGASMHPAHCCMATNGLLVPPPRNYLPQRKGRIPGLSARTTRGWIMILARLIHAYQAWRSYERSMSELARLDDRELADIGISRAEIPAVAWGTRRAP